MGRLFFKKYKLFGIAILITFVIMIAYQLIVFEKYHLVPGKTNPLNARSVLILEVKTGMSLRSITKTLYQTPGVRKAPGFLFEAFVRFYKKGNCLKAGEYQLEPGITPKQLLAKMVKGDIVYYAFTIIEGWTTLDLFDKLNQHPYITREVQSHLKPGFQSEGLFFPDTYYFSKGMTNTQFLNRSMQVLQKHLAKEWHNRDPHIILKTPYEALILASIIEKETAVASERVWVSSVFHERLKLNMPLQADPTVIYGAGKEYKDKISSAMLRQDTPYNTYVHKGLPPTPIALPGLAAIHAALHPQKILGVQPYLYFVAKGDGTHYFSKTITEHNAAVRKYILEKHSKK